MPIRNSFKYQDIVVILEHFECKLVRTSKGSHTQRHSFRVGRKFTVPNHGPKEIKMGTLFSILKRAGVSKEEVLDYLKGKKSDG